MNNKNFMRHLLLPMITIFLLFIPFTISIEPTQQYSKILLEPFYRDSMIRDIWYNYSIDISVPDGMSNIKSGIVTLDAWINPTRTFRAKVNDVYCMNDYTISTTYANSGRGVVTFDCSNAIIPNSVNIISIMVTGGNIGSSTSWIDITYENNPKGDIELMGTHYYPNEQATMFLQLIDNNDNPINNGTCYLNIWNPQNSSGEHSRLLIDSPMLQAIGNEGLYYYDMYVPNITGVYMLSAKCNYAYNYEWIYDKNEIVHYPISRVMNGNCLNSTFTLNSPTDGLYQYCSGTNVQVNYTFNITERGLINNITNINLYYGGESVNSQTLVIAYYDGLNWINLPNTLKYTGTVSVQSLIPSGRNEYLTNVVPLNATYNNETLMFRLTYSGNNQHFFNNWLSLAILTSTGTIHNLKGSSEMVVSNRLMEVNQSINDNIDYTRENLYNITLNINNSIINEINLSSQSILSNISEVNQTINTNIDYTRYNLTTRIDNLDSSIQSQFYNISLQINSLLINLTQQLDNVITYILSVPYNVWNYNYRNLTYYEHIDMTNYTNITNNIWSYDGRYTHGIILD